MFEVGKKYRWKRECDIRPTTGTFLFTKDDFAVFQTGNAQWWLSKSMWNLIERIN